VSELHDLTLTEAAQGIAAGKFSATELTRHMLDRIAELDATLHSFVVVAENAMEQAAACDAVASNATKTGGPLNGVPIALKDLYDTKDMPTSNGSPVFVSWASGVDATAVARLRAAGAIIIGKLTMTEGACPGYHPTISAPINPWNADYWPGASSSGSGVATAARLCFGSLGSDTAGSIRFPAYACGNTGLKPTWGRVSRAGVFALAESLDTVGPITRNARDAAAMLAAMAGPDPADPTALQADVPDYVDGLEQGIRGLRIGLDEAYVTNGVDAEVNAVVMAAVDVLRDAGGEIVAVQHPDTTLVTRLCPPYWCAEMTVSHSEMFAAHADEYGPVLRSLIESGQAMSAHDLAVAEIERQKFKGQLAALFETVDVLLMPVAPDRPQSNAAMDTLGSVEGDIERLIMFTAIHNMAGVPTLTLPGGVDENSGLLIGFQLVGPHLSEDRLLRAGHTYQQATDWHTRRPPLAP